MHVESMKSMKKQQHFGFSLEKAPVNRLVAFCHDYGPLKPLIEISEACIPYPRI